MIDEKKNDGDIFEFLLGEMPFNGCWFGERQKYETGAFWWRKHLREALEARAASQPFVLGTYECHITVGCPSGSKELCELEELGKQHKWKTSIIHGDPQLGKEDFFYFTKHAVSFEKIKEEMTRMVGIIGANKVIRQKIEHIVFDTKTGINAASQPAVDEDILRTQITDAILSWQRGLNLYETGQAIIALFRPYLCQQPQPMTEHDEGCPQHGEDHVCNGILYLNQQPSAKVVEAARKCVEELAHTKMELSLEDWQRISSTILRAIAAMKEGK